MPFATPLAYARHRRSVRCKPRPKKKNQPMAGFFISADVRTSASTFALAGVAHTGSYASNGHHQRLFNPRIRFAALAFLLA